MATSSVNSGVTVFTFENEDDRKIARDIHIEQLERRDYKPAPDVTMFIEAVDVEEVERRLKQRGVNYKTEPL